MLVHTNLTGELPFSFSINESGGKQTIPPIPACECQQVLVPPLSPPRKPPLFTKQSLLARVGPHLGCSGHAVLGHLTPTQNSLMATYALHGIHRKYYSYTLPSPKYPFGVERESHVALC